MLSRTSNHARRIFAILAAFITSLAIAGSITPAATAAEQLDHGHMDIVNPVFVDGQIVLQLKEDVTGHGVHRAPEDVLLRVKQEAWNDENEAEQLKKLIGHEGYFLPDPQDYDLLWPGWDTLELGAAGFTTANINFVSVDGPGKVFIFQNGNLGGIEPVLTNGSLELTSGSVHHQDYLAHKHVNWVFTDPGEYVMRINVTTEKDGQAYESNTATYTWSVGDKPEPEQPPTTDGNNGGDNGEPGGADGNENVDTADGNTGNDSGAGADSGNSSTDNTGAIGGNNDAGNTNGNNSGNADNSTGNNGSNGSADNNSGNGGSNNKPVVVPDEQPAPDQPGGTPGSKPGASADKPGGANGTPGVTPGKPADNPGGKPGTSTDKPGATPNTPADKPDATPGSQPVVSTQPSEDPSVAPEATCFPHKVEGDDSLVLTPMMKDDRSAPAQWVDPQSLPFLLSDTAKTTTPQAIGAIPGGSTVWMIGATQVQGVPWLGANTMNESVMNKTTGAVTWTLSSFSGPGRMEVYTSGNFGQIVGEKWFSDAGGSVTIPRNTHVHPNWLFSEPGTYQVGITQTATLNTGEYVTGYTTLTFNVGGGSGVDNGHFDLGSEIGHGEGYVWKDADGNPCTPTADDYRAAGMTPPGSLASTGVGGTLYLAGLATVLAVVGAAAIRYRRRMLDTIA